jgi:hypothetical protein
MFTGPGEIDIVSEKTHIAMNNAIQSCSSGSRSPDATARVIRVFGPLRRVQRSFSDRPAK